MQTKETFLLRKLIRQMAVYDPSREADLRKRIIGYIMNHKNKTVDQAAADDLLTIAADATYKNALPKYKKGQLYKGASVSGKWLEKNFGVTYETLLDGKRTEEKDDSDNYDI